MGFSNTVKRDPFNFLFKLMKIKQIMDLSKNYAIRDLK